jgi:hypothetical protein
VPPPNPDPVPVQLPDVTSIPAPDVPMSVSQLARYLGVTVNVLYEHVEVGALVLDCEVPFHRDRTCRGASPESIAAYLQTKRAQRTILNSRKSAPQRRARRGA